MAEPEYCILLLDAPCLSQTLWAAWVQAVGSVLAIAVAILIPYLQHRKGDSDRKEDRRLRARSLALAILVPLRRHFANLGLLLYRYQSDGANPSRSVVAIEARPNDQLQSFISLSHELGPAAAQFQDAMRSSQKTADFAESINNREQYGLREDFGAQDEQIRLGVIAATALTLRAIEHIEQLFE